MAESSPTRYKASAIQASHVAKEWVDFALIKSKEEESHRFAATKAQALAKKKTKETLTKLAETKKARKSTEVAVAGAKMQVEEQRGYLWKAEEQLVLAQEKIEIQRKELEGKEEEVAKAKQAAYELGQKETRIALSPNSRRYAVGFAFRFGLRLQMLLV
ncbi:hypothetical protein SO802_002600 [Lithocarpus litseifolius]|uniref:Uncharacterized protein n=1 Tax=Lithocarpus litseifolius TaxID=425828 RepID=A0AAW2E3B2_9ROSI